MSNLSYYNDKDIGEVRTREENGFYPQAVVLRGNTEIVKCAGIRGWDQNNEVEGSLHEQIERAIANVDRVLRAAGLRGWEDVYLVRSYHIDMRFHYLLHNEIKRRIPGHFPIWTCVGVQRLDLPEMLIELEVEAARRN